MAEDDQKTEPATAEKRRKAREQGDIPKVKDAGGVAAGMGVLLVLSMGGAAAVKALAVFTMQCFREPFDFVRGDPTGLVSRATGVLAALTMPSAIAAAIAASAVTFAQVGFNPRFDLVMPNFGRIDPLGKIKSLLMPADALVGLLQSLLRVAVIGYFVYGSLRDALPLITHLSRADIRGAAAAVADALGGLVMHATFGLALLAAGDYLWSRFRWEQTHRMSKQEIKDEYKQQEGDPRMKQQLRSRARQRLKKGMVKAIRASDAVLANPTHISVALRYKAKEGAPVVTAKGYDETALHIREIAKAAGIPIIENRVLARALAARVRVGKAIPVDLYAAVAEVLAFVYRLRGRRVA